MSSTSLVAGGSKSQPVFRPPYPGVAIVGTFLSSAGGRISIAEELAERLRRRNWRIVPIGHSRSKLGRIAEIVGSLVRQREQFRVAQVELYSGKAFVWAELACACLQFMRRPYIIALHGGLLPSFAAKHPRRVSRLLRSACLVTAPSSYLRDGLASFRSDIVVVPNGLESCRYSFRLRTESQPKLIWLRAFHEIYNPVLAVEVLALVVKEFPDATLTMFGPDKHDGSLAAVRERAQELAMGSRLQIPGAVSKQQVGDSLNKGDIFLNTSNVDNTPVSVLESQACGLCVVSTNAGGLSRVLQHEIDALLVSPNDAPGMASAICRILKDKALSERLSGNGHQKAMALDWGGIVSQWEELFLKYA